jgi:hypothetical protein
MRRVALICGFALLAVLTNAAVAPAHDETKYPDWKGQWYRPGGGQGGQWDPTKRPGRAQQPPLTAEYQAVWEAGLANTEAGGMGNLSTVRCIPSGMPRMMVVFEPIEIIVTPPTTYIRFTYFSEFRRIHTDGRAWPAKIAPSLTGYSIGTWEDTDGDGRYDTLTIETRGFRGPRTFDGNIPMHTDNQTVIRERLTLDPANPNQMHNEVSTIDHALTRPWTIKRTYLRLSKPQPVWMEYVCHEGNRHVSIGAENYVVSADGYLMPVKKDQPPPDLRNFEQPPR